MTPGKAFLTPDEIRSFNHRSDLWGFWLIAHCWGVIGLCWRGHDLRDAVSWRGVAGALAGDFAVDDGHADAGQVAQLDAFEDVFAGRVLGLIHQDEISAFADLEEAGVKFTTAARVAVGKTEGCFGGDVAEA